MDDQEFNEQVINSYEIMYMVETFLAASCSQHLTATGVLVGLLRIAARCAKAADNEENRDAFMSLAEEISRREPSGLCGCTDCITARAAARNRVKENWDMEIPTEFPPTVGNA